MDVSFMDNDPGVICGVPIQPRPAGFGDKAAPLIAVNGAE